MCLNFKKPLYLFKCRILLIIFGHAHSMQMFPGQGLKPHHISDYARSLTCHTTRESLILLFGIFWNSFFTFFPFAVGCRTHRHMGYKLTTRHFSQRHNIPLNEFNVTNLIICLLLLDTEVNFHYFWYSQYWDRSSHWGAMGLAASQEHWDIG